ncbi:MAG: hypothetical protein HY534_02135 [Chloroflexi bacterium]|nr:hypothetical protein [Chloroflexota bacterium]
MTWIWLALSIQEALDTAEDGDDIATLRCANCALPRYGPRLAQMLTREVFGDEAAA